MRVRSFELQVDVSVPVATATSRYEVAPMPRVLSVLDGDPNKSVPETRRVSGTQLLPASAPNLTPVPSSKHTVPRLVVSPRSDEFRRRFYPQAGLRDWNDWRWQNRSRVRSLAELDRLLNLTDAERQAIEIHRGPCRLALLPTTRAYWIQKTRIRACAGP